MARSMSRWRCGNCAAGSIWRGTPGPAARPPKRCRIAGDGPRGPLGAADPGAPKAVSAAVAAEQARRKLNEATGKYLLADQISLELGKAPGSRPARYRRRLGRARSPLVAR